MIRTPISPLGATGGLGALTTASVMAIRAVRHRAPRSPAPGPRRDEARTVGADAAEHLSALIRCATVSRRAPATTDTEQFGALLATMREHFPRLDSALTCERVGDHGLMYRWAGTEPAGADQPLVLMAHLDVVPAEGEGWTHPPFSGHVDDERVWGRGALDDKGPLVTVLAAVERLLEQGHTPRRDVYLCLGDNEEVAGATAETMAELLRRRGVTPWLVLDEGGAVVDGGVVPGVDHPAAMVGVAEKGLLDVELVTTSPGGHASTPPRMGATARLARAVWRLEKNPFPASLPPVTRTMVEELGRHAPFAHRLLYANLGLLSRPFTAVLRAAGPETAALTRTTAAVTQLSGSPAANVLADRATATVNLRLAVGTTSADAVAYLHRVIADDQVGVRVLGSTEPSRVSRTDNEAYRVLTRCIQEAFPDAVPAPYVMNQATDSRRFAPHCDSVYRFAPLRMSAADREAIHGADESVTIETLGEGVLFMADLITRADQR